MATGLLTILDDVALLMDDVAVMSKTAAKKTAGILGDDLAVNAEKATGFNASRELPVIWTITKGSFLNKLIILPIVFLLSAFAPWLIVPIMLIGGAYLCYEGAEKILEWMQSKQKPPATDEEKAALALAHQAPDTELEKTKIRSAIRTDFILSIEIILLALEPVLQHSLLVQVMVVSLIALVATVGVYGLVALLVRMDDTGYWFIQRANITNDSPSLLQKSQYHLGNALVTSLPWIIKTLTVVGTLAMLLVGGGMYLHNVHVLHPLSDALPSPLIDLLIGALVGIIAVMMLSLWHRLKPQPTSQVKEAETEDTPAKTVKNNEADGQTNPQA